jgi:hypothetical protein
VRSSWSDSDDDTEVLNLTEALSVRSSANPSDTVVDLPSSTADEDIADMSSPEPSSEKRAEEHRLRRQHMLQYARWGESRSFLSDLLLPAGPLAICSYYVVILILGVRAIWAKETCSAPLFSVLRMQLLHALLAAVLPLAFLYTTRLRPVFLQQLSLSHPSNRYWRWALIALLGMQILLLFSAESKVGPLGVGGQRSFMMCIVRAPVLFSTVRWIAAIHLLAVPVLALMLARYVSR